MSPYTIETILEVDTKTAPLSVVIDAMIKKDMETYVVTSEDAREEPFDCMILCAYPT